MKGPDGEIASFIAIKHDVTERRAGEEAQRFLAAIVESSEEAIIACTPEAVILTWNRGAEAVFGYPTGDAVGKPLSMLVAPERLPRLPHFVQQILQGNAIRQEESVCLRQDGERIHVSVTGSPIRNQAGAVGAISIVVRDVLESRRAENALRESEDRFRIMADGCPTMMWVNQCKGGQSVYQPGVPGIRGYYLRADGGRQMATGASCGRCAGVC